MTELSIRSYQPEGRIIAMRAPEARLRLNVYTQVTAEVTILTCKGRITYRDEAAELTARVLDVMQRGRRLILEISGVERIDSAGLGELVSIFTWSRAVGCALTLVGPNRLVRHLLDLTKMSSVLAIYSTIEEALESRAVLKT